METMAKYIDSDAFLAHERAWYCDNCDRRKNSKGKTCYEIGDAPCRACDIVDVLDLLEDYPTADVVERKTGKWMTTEAFPHHVYCSVCYKTYIPNDSWQIWQDHYNDGGLPRNYCPNCGAKMIGGDDDGNQ